jgi:predicted phosphoadenosine phosphosulfate sulfurtransferase
MGKIYTDKNVYDAAIERINLIFDEFEHIYLSLSGGKDSSALAQLMNQVAIKRNRTFDIMFIDYEAQYEATINHIYELKKLSNIKNFYHICWSFKANNATSVFDRFWYPWDEKYKKKWVRKLPKDSINKNNHPEDFEKYFVNDLFLRGMFEAFTNWYKHINKTNKVANLQGIRADESLNRFRAIALGKNMYKKLYWSTDNFNGCYSFYPIYDWSTQDIWGCVSKYDFSYNHIYELMFKSGMSIHESRIAQPFGLSQKNSLNQWAKFEPDTWEKIVNRVSGANFGALYAKTTLLGNNGTEKPNHMTWEQYTVFLLESLGLYCNELEKHYYRKIRIYIDHYIKEGRIKLQSEIPDEIDKKTVKETIGRENGRWIQWKRIAKCIEKNDFALTGCNYGITKADKNDMRNLKSKWKELLSIPTNTKEMARLKEEIENEQ